MKKSIISGWEMCLRIQNFLKGNPTVVGAIVGVAAAKAALDAKIADIADLKKQWLDTTEGYTMDKNAVKADLVTVTSENIEVVIAFATIAKNQSLIATLKKILKKIDKTGATSLLSEAGRVFDVMQENLVALLPWEIDAASQTAFKAKIDAYEDIMSQPRQIAKKRKRMGADIAAKTKDLIADLKSLDNLVNALRKKHPDFVKDYQLMRRVDNQPTTKRAGIFQILDEVTKAPIAKAKVVTPFGVYKSTAKGNLIIKSAPEGSCEVTVIKPGCADATFPLVFVSGVTTKQVFYLQAAA